MSDIRVLPEQANRVETGPVQFGSDWPGLFIRGDDAAYLWAVLSEVLRAAGDDLGPIEKVAAESFLETLKSCRVKG